MPLTTLSDVQVYLGRTVGADPQLESVVDAVTPMIEKYCNRTFDSAAATEYYSGQPGDLWLARSPVTAIASVYLKQDMYFGVNAPTSSDLLVEGDDYIQVKEPGESYGQRLRYIRFGGGNAFLNAYSMYTGWGTHARRTLSGAGGRIGWPDGDGNIRVTYTAGYATIPDDLKMAANMLAGFLFAKAQNGGLFATGSSLGPYSESFDSRLSAIGLQSFTDPADPAGVVGILKAYRRSPWASQQ